MKTSLLISTLILTVLTAGTASAETPRGAGGDDATRRAQYVIRQLSQEKSDLQAQNAQLQAELEDLRSRVARLEKEVDRSGRELSQSRQTNDRLVERVRNDQEKTHELMDRYQDTARLATLQKNDLALLKNAVVERNAWIDRCKANNDALSKLNMELVERYQDKGFWQTLTESDPLTGLGKVKLEVIADKYRYRIEDLQVTRYQDAAQVQAATTIAH